VTPDWNVTIEANFEEFALAMRRAAEAMDACAAAFVRSLDGALVVSRRMSEPVPPLRRAIALGGLDPQGDVHG